MKNLTFILFCTLMFTCACSKDAESGGAEPVPETPQEQARQNMTRAMALVDNTMATYFVGNEMSMARYYNPYNGSLSSETGSIWMYTSSIEAVNAILHGLQAMKSAGDSELYDANFTRYAQLLSQLYDGADYYLGTFTLTSFTQTKEWTVYGVNRSSGKGSAAVEGIQNVYDDQQWFIREMIEAYKLTGEAKYLERAEYLTAYVLDGWDYTLNANGDEEGGIPWGPGYTTKHACSNGPMVSPLVWLYEIYRTKDDRITRPFIDFDGNRKSETMKKSTYYLNFAKDIYDWQQRKLMRADGVYDDMLGGCSSCEVAYETVDGVRYRANTPLTTSVGPAYSYNSGTMISGAADLYRVTRDKVYLEDLKALSDASFATFAKLDASVKGYYTYEVSGFRDWFNGVLMRGYTDACTYYEGAAVGAESFQRNLDYAYANYNYKGFLPVNLLVGWNQDKGKNNLEGMFQFAFAAEYAVLARYEMGKDN